MSTLIDDSDTLSEHVHKNRELENVAINDVLPLKAARRDAIAHVIFGALGHHPPNFDGCIYIRYAVPPYSARIRAIYIFTIAGSK